MSFVDEMEQYDESFDKERESATAAGVLEDGPHQAQVTESYIDKSDDGRYTWIVKFQNPKGSVRKWYNLDHEVGRSVAASDCKSFGYEGKLSGLEQACEEEFFIGLVCEIKVKTKPGTDRDFTNVYVNRVLGKQDLGDFAADDSPGSSQGNSDDDIPF